MPSVEMLKYKAALKAAKRKRKRSVKAAKKEVRKKKRAKRRKKIKLAFKKIGSGAMKVLKSPVFKSTLGLIGDQALNAVASAVPGGALIQGLVKSAGGKAMNALKHADDPEKMKAMLKEAANEAKSGAVAYGTEKLGSKITNVDNPKLKLALQKSLDYAKKASKATSMKELGKNISADTMAQIAKMKKDPLAALTKAGNLVAPKAMEKKEIQHALALAKNPSAKKVLEFYEKYKNLLPK